MPPLRTYVYIDGFNLYYGLLKKTSFKWVNLDSLCRLYLDSSKNQIIKIKYFIALVKSRINDPDQHIRQQTYLRALKTIPHIEIIKGHFLSHVVNMPLADGSGYVDVIKTEEKKSDVNIAVHMMHDAYENNYDLAVLISNDSDLSEPIRIISNEMGKKVGILNPQETNSHDLGKNAIFQKKMRPGALANCQFPENLQDNAGKFHKPKKWY